MRGGGQTHRARTDDGHGKLAPVIAAGARRPCGRCGCVRLVGLPRHCSAGPHARAGRAATTRGVTGGPRVRTAAARALRGAAAPNPPGPAPMTPTGGPPGSSPPVPAVRGAGAGAPGSSFPPATAVPVPTLAPAEQPQLAVSLAVAEFELPQHDSLAA